MLTSKQFKLLNYISSYLQETGMSPSFDEMKEALDLKSKSGIHRLITSLEERGFLRRLTHRARALEVLKTPDEALPYSLRNSHMLSTKQPGSVKSNVKFHQVESPLPISVADKEPTNEDYQYNKTSTPLPFHGKITESITIDALHHAFGFIDIPSSMIQKNLPHYVMEVNGNFMVNTGILDGDMLIVCKCNTATNGTLIIAIIDENEVSLKRLFWHNDSIVLESSNTSLPPQSYDKERITIQGRVTGLFRYY